MKRGSKHTKRLNVSKLASLKNKKQDVWVVRTNPGPHPKESSVPLSVLVRDVLNYAQTLKEAKKIISSGHVYVDGRVVKDYRFPIGVMDVVSFPVQGVSYRMVINTKGKLVPVKINETQTKVKIAQIKNKYVQSKGRVTVTLHDGKNIILSEEQKSYSPGDSVVITLPKVKIEKHIPLKEGALCYIIKGKHIGEVARVVEFRDLGMGRKQAKLERDDGTSFYTIKKYLFPIDDVKWVSQDTS